MRRSLTCTTRSMCLRQVYAEPEFTQQVLDQYKPGTEGFDRTWQLYLKLEALRKK